MIRCTLTERGVAFDGIDLLYLGKSTWRNAIIFGVDSYNVKRSENKNNDFLIKSIEPREVGVNLGMISSYFNDNDASVVVL